MVLVKLNQRRQAGKVLIANKVKSTFSFDAAMLDLTFRSEM